jgi:hypothetical protein
MDWDDARFAIGVSLVVNGFLRTAWMALCFAVLGVSWTVAVYNLVVNPGYWWACLFLFWFGYQFFMSINDYWWEKWTGEYDKGPDLSFLVPQYMNDNLEAMQYPEYQPRHAARVDVYGNPL